MSTRGLLEALCSAVLFCGAGWAAAEEPGTPQSDELRPKPWGTGATYYYQTQPYGLESLKLGLPPGVPAIDPAVTKGLDVRNTTETELLTVDYWVLPFLNLQALVGRIETETKVPLSTVNIGIPLGDLDVKAKGMLYGGGVTLAYGTHRFFGTLTGQYTAAILDEEGASATALVVSPRLGAVVLKRATIYVGAMYQRPSEEHSGKYDVPPLGSVDYSVKLTSADKWSGLAGATFAITPHWLLTAEGGFGKRHSLLTHLDYRW
jgi:hypothetical protein